MTTRRHRGDESGQALVEFAIILPVLVLVFLFSMWFYELAQLKLKVQEAARYAAWEATAFRLHEYKLGGPGRGFLRSGRMTLQVIAESRLRYADMDSATRIPTGSRSLSASWSAPQIFVLDLPEEVVPGGQFVNLFTRGGAYAYDLLSSAVFQNARNPVAQSLLRTGFSTGGAGAMRILGNPAWGFNQRGYVHSYAWLTVRNEWFGSGVGRLLVPSPGVVLSDSDAVLADAWQMYDGKDTVGLPAYPGYDFASPLWHQVKRMYFVHTRTEMVARAHIATFVAGMQAAVGLTGGFGMLAPMVEEFMLPSVVSKSYTFEVAGKTWVRQDFPPVAAYDTAPFTGEYKATYRQRGRYFMGCKLPMQLGCAATLAQDNPFASYIIPNVP